MHGDLSLLRFSVAISNSKTLGSGASGYAVFISVCLTPLTVCTRADHLIPGLIFFPGIYNM